MSGLGHSVKCVSTSANGAHAAAYATHGGSNAERIGDMREQQRATSQIVDADGLQIRVATTDDSASIEIERSPGILRWLYRIFGSTRQDSVMQFTVGGAAIVITVRYESF